MDPGIHTITVRMPRAAVWETTVTAIEGGTLRVKLPDSLRQIAVATPEPAVTPVTQETAAAAPAAQPPPTEPPPQQHADHGNTQRNAGLVVAGAGLISLGVGTYYGVHSMDLRNDSRSHCNGNVCDADGVSLRSDALSAGNISTVTLIAGLATAVGGGVLFFTAPSSSDRQGDSARAATPPRARLLSAAPYAGTTGAGIALTGEFR